MRAMTMPNMFGGIKGISPVESTRPRKLPENLKNIELKRKLCYGSAERCRGCEVLDMCRFGQQGVERKMQEGPWTKEIKR